jgi:ABC-2 type transport system permease protein/lipopolysaccharide transport system permease protein
MTLSTEVPPSPPSELAYRVHINLVTDLGHLWRERHLVRTIAERDLRSRYKQLFLGWGWSVVTPFITVVVFTYFFHRITNIKTAGVPYPLFMYVGLLSWNFFAASVSKGASSLLDNSSILNKLFCPREIFPLAGVVLTAVDTLISTIPLAVLFVLYHRALPSTVAWLPLLILVEVVFVVGVTMAFSTMMVYVRDLGLILAGILQAGFFLTPVAFPLNVVPVRYRLLYSAVNPLAAVIDSARRVVFLGEAPNWRLIGAATATSVVVVIVGYVIFRRLEGGIADVA